MEAKRTTKEDEAMRAAIYCRVSTDSQESEGTSLQTQLEACQKHCQDKGYDVHNRFSEVYSGLTLDRPYLSELRELVRSEQIDVLVIYCLDRLSRDPTHGVILTQELEKHGIDLEAVIEDVDNTELGKLISYIRGFSSKLEAEKIKERTARGKKARAMEGKIPNGGYQRLYGYSYIGVKEKKGGRRLINEDEAQWVRQMFHWLVNEGMSTYAIALKLNNLNVPSKFENRWSRHTVYRVLTNIAYTGKTLYEGIELSSTITPQIINEELFKTARKQLKINYQKASRNSKREYLLHGHLYCRQCGRAYWTHICIQRRKNKKYEYRRYVCSGALRIESFASRCQNKGWMAGKLEEIVWQKIEKILSQPELIITEINKLHQCANQKNHVDTELKHVQRRIKTLAKEQEQLLQWALKGFPEEAVIQTNKSINEKRANLAIQEKELHEKLENCQEAAMNLPKIEGFIQFVQNKLTNLDYQTKRLALMALSTKIWIDGYDVEITGSIPLDDYAIVQPSSR